MAIQAGRSQWAQLNPEKPAPVALILGNRAWRRAATVSRSVSTLNLNRAPPKAKRLHPSGSATHILSNCPLGERRLDDRVEQGDPPMSPRLWVVHWSWFLTCFGSWMFPMRMTIRVTVHRLKIERYNALFMRDLTPYERRYLEQQLEQECADCSAAAGVV